MLRLIKCAVLCAVVIGVALQAHASENDLFEETVNAIEDCRDNPVTLCIKERALKIMESLPSEYDFGGGLVMRPTAGAQRSARFFSFNALPVESGAREQMVDQVLMDRIVDYLSSHSFQFKVPEDTIREFKRSLDEADAQLEEYEEDDVESVGEGRKKKKKMLPILLLLKMKAAAAGAIMLKMIALLAFKALVIAKIALLLASIIALKKLVDHKHHHAPSYEVIAAHPYEDHGHSFDRSFDTSELPYRAYAPEHIK